MADFYKVTVKRQHVFHDGTSMVVLKPKGQNPEVADHFIKRLVDDGAIDKPKGWEEPKAVEEGVVMATADGGFTANLPQTEVADEQAEGGEGTEAP